jgi:hypothetical protein
MRIYLEDMDTQFQTIGVTMRMTVDEAIALVKSKLKQINTDNFALYEYNDKKDGTFF